MSTSLIPGTRESYPIILMSVEFNIYIYAFQSCLSSNRNDSEYPIQHPLQCALAMRWPRPFSQRTLMPPIMSSSESGRQVSIHPVTVSRWPLPIFFIQLLWKLCLLWRVNPLYSVWSWSIKHSIIVWSRDTLCIGFVDTIVPVYP